MAKYAVDCASMSSDFCEAVAFNLRQNKVDSNKHITQAFPVF